MCKRIGLFCVYLNKPDSLETRCLVFPQVLYNQLSKLNKKLSTANIDYIALFTDSINTFVKLFLILNKGRTYKNSL